MIGRVSFNITTAPTELPLKAFIQIIDKQGKIVANQSVSTELNGFVDIPNATLWWPYLMHTTVGYLYTLEVNLKTSGEKIVDIYRLKIGIRTLQWNSTQFLINGKPIYFRGFGKHEDSDVYAPQ